MKDLAAYLDKRRKMIDWLVDWVPPIVLVVMGMLITVALPMMVTRRARVFAALVAVIGLYAAVFLQPTLIMMIIVMVGIAAVTVASTLNYS